MYEESCQERQTEDWSFYMKVLVVGGGGREHAIIWKLSQSPRITKLYCAPGNGGIDSLAQCVDIKATNIEGILAFAIEQQMDLTVVAPDDPLAMGLVDKLQENGLRAFGPTQKAAIIESSKVFAKELMKKHRIPTPEYQSFQKYDDAIAFLDEISFPVVIKADGLALGKGVIIASSKEEAEKTLSDMLLDNKFGEAGKRVLIEEHITGPEVSILAFTDGKTVIPMVSSQDHKRAYDYDEGPNTGGMGAFSPSPHYTPEAAKYVEENIIVPTIRAMAEEGRHFQGVLYFGLMLTSSGPKVLEYNARFGDPEAQVILPRLQTDLLEIMEAIVDKKLDEMEIRWDERAAVCVVLASGGYPGSYQKGRPIKIKTGNPDFLLFHAGTHKTEQGFVTNGGRIIGITALGKDLGDAVQRVYSNIENVNFEGMHYRKDIGKKADS